MPRRGSAAASVAFTYNDPTIFLSTRSTSRRHAARGDQDGRRHRRLHLRRAPRRVLPHIDAANVDLKGFTEEFYHKICGGHLQRVLDTFG